MRKKKNRILRRLRRAGVCLAGVMVLSALLLGAAWVLSPFPEHRLEKWSTSPTVLDVRGRDMLSIVGQDQQRRRPVPLDRISPWLVQATIAVEDQRFYDHPGLDLAAVARALGQNISAGRIVSGASTVNMQICRMMDNRPRTLWAKAVESLRALQLDQLKTKDEILTLYLNVAPYGGNLRGVEAASLAYFGKHAADLSLGEAALLAGLPKSPSRYRPDRNLSAALKRRNVVLGRMLDERMISQQQHQQVRADPIVICKARPLRRASHAAWLALGRRPKGGRTTIDLDIQDQLQALVDEHRRRLPDGTEQAVVVIDIARSAITAMVGSGDPKDPVDGQVNGVVARRSPGSALKPFIYAAAFEAGRLSGESIVYDLPIQREGWAPLNFDRAFSGEVTAADALRRSLNIPAILVAEGVGLARCCGVLEAAGVHLTPDVQARGGLALAVGGVEVTLLDLTNAYATLGRGGVRQSPRLFADEPTSRTRAMDANVCAAIGDILSSRRRRPRGMANRLPGDVPWFMWKTGTSAGRRDAWAVGHNGRYAIGVWVGRFRGTGRVRFVGAEAAEPLLAALFDLPVLRTSADPPPAQEILVRRPLPRPPEAAGALRITAPGNGETFIAIGGKAAVHPRANRPETLTWFLNGQLIGDKLARRLVLKPDRYELRCIDAAGRSASVCFVVCSADAAWQKTFDW